RPHYQKRRSRPPSPARATEKIPIGLDGMMAVRDRNLDRSAQTGIQPAPPARRQPLSAHFSGRSPDSFGLALASAGTCRSTNGPAMSRAVRAIVELFGAS